MLPNLDDIPPKLNGANFFLIWMLPADVSMKNIQRVEIIIDDVLIYGRTTEEHNKRHYKKPDSSLIKKSVNSKKRD